MGGGAGSRAGLADVARASGFGFWLGQAARVHAGLPTNHGRTSQAFSVLSVTGASSRSA